MTVSVAEIAANTASVTFQVGPNPGDTLTVEYYPGRVTEDIISQVNGFASADRSNYAAQVAQFAAFNEVLASLIHAWDLYEDKEQTTLFPIDGARFSKLPLGFRMSVLQHIMDDLRPNDIAPQVTQTPSSSI